MTLFQFADSIQTELRITYHPGQEGRFTAYFYGAEVKSDPTGFLYSVYGEGKSPNDALTNYAGKIQGKTLVFDATNEDRREVKVPGTLNPHRSFGEMRA